MDNVKFKKSEKKSFDYKSISLDYLMESHVSMFEYFNLPKTVNPFFLEKYLQTQGIVVWLKDDIGDVIAIEGTLAGDLDVYGLGRDVIAVTRNGQSYQLKRDINCVVAFNDLSMSPCLDIYRDAETLSDIRTSLDFLIFWTRLSPLIRVSDEKIKIVVEEAYRNIKKGVPVTIASKKILSEFNIPDDIIIQDITQPDFADKIQYTSKLYDDVLRWHFTKYGQAINGDGKTAQQTVDEVNSTTSQSLVLPLSMLRMRKDMIERVNAMFSLNIEVELAGAWRAEVTKYEDESGEDNIDDSADDSARDADAASDSTSDALPDDRTDGEGAEQ